MVSVVGGPSGALGGFYSPISEQEDGACFFRKNLQAQLLQHAPLIPATEAEIDAACDHLCQRRVPITHPAPGIPSLMWSIEDNKPTLILFPLKKLTIKKGDFKEITPSLMVEYSPLQRTFLVSQKAFALIRQFNHLPKDKRIRCHEIVFREIELLQELTDALKEKGISTAYLVAPYETVVHKKSYLQDWHPSDLENALNDGKVHLGFNPADAPKPFHKEHALSCLLDVAKTLSILHRLGYVHRDVALRNVLASYENGQFIGRLADFTFATNKFGWDPLNEQRVYELWDPLAVCNISTPLVDRYGVALMLISLLSPSITWQDLVSIRDGIICSMVMGLRANFNPNSNIPFEKELRSLCLHSMHILFSILWDAKVYIPTRFANERSRKENINLSDSQLSLKLLQDLVKEHQRLFTHDRIVTAMENSARSLAEQGYTVCTMEGLIAHIDKAHFEQSMGTEFGFSDCAIC